MVDFILGPDIFVNASVALGTDPDRVAQKVLSQPQRGGSKPKTTLWVLEQVAIMLRAHPHFSREAIDPHVKMIASLMDVIKNVPATSSHGSATETWKHALVDSAKACGASRVVTDHPDLADHAPIDGVEFISSQSWLLDQAIPPPPPG